MEEKESKRTLWQRVQYDIVFAIWYSVSRLPMCILYAFSTILSSILFYVIRYRRKVVHKNIKDSYPNKSPRDRFIIERKFYLHFCDILMESVKYFSISEKELRKRLVYINTEQVAESCRNGKSAGIFLGHYANWEWVSSLPLWISPNIAQSSQLYHVLENPTINRLIEYTRQRWGGVNIPVAESVRHMVRMKQQGKPFIVGFVADQVPFWNNIHYWTEFLNHPDTPVFTGAERLMKKFDMDVYYLEIKCPKRGYYTAEFKLMTTAPKTFPDYELTERFTRLLEATINEAPQFWLWSHKRWKRTKEEWLRINKLS